MKIIIEKKKKGLWANIHAKRKRGEKPAKPGDDAYPDKKQWDKLTEEELEEAVLEEIEKIFEEQEEDPKKAAEQNIKNAEKLVTSTEKEVQAKNAQNSAMRTDEPNLRKAQIKGLESKRAELAAAKSAVKSAKDAAVKTSPVTEEKSNFQKEMEKKGKGWKVRLLTKGKQEAGVAFPNKAPTDRAKSAPPLQEGKYGDWLKEIEKDAFIVLNALFSMDLSDTPEINNIIKQIKETFSFAKDNSDKIRQDYKKLINSVELTKASLEAEKLLSSDRKKLTGLFYDGAVQKEILESLVEMGFKYNEVKGLVNFLNLGNATPGATRNPVRDEYGEEDVAPLEKPIPQQNKTVTGKAGEKSSPKPVTMGPEDSEIAARRARAQGDKTQP